MVKLKDCSDATAAVSGSMLIAHVSIDLHSHLIPGIDDGSKEIEETIEILHIMSKLGYKKLITYIAVDSIIILWRCFYFWCNNSG